MNTERKCAVLLLPGPADETALRRAAERARTETDWGALEIEIFPGRAGTLLLIRPAAGLYIKEDAVRFVALYAGKKAGQDS